MNYIAGYIYLIFKDEKLAYNLFDKVMDKYFVPIFINELS